MSVCPTFTNAVFPVEGTAEAEVFSGCSDRFDKYSSYLILKAFADLKLKFIVNMQNLAVVLVPHKARLLKHLVSEDRRLLYGDGPSG